MPLGAVGVYYAVVSEVVRHVKGARFRKVNYNTLVFCLAAPALA